MQSIDHIQNIILDIKYENALLDKFIEEHADDLIYDEMEEEKMMEEQYPLYPPTDVEQYLPTDVRYVVPPRRLLNVTKS